MSSSFFLKQNRITGLYQRTNKWYSLVIFLSSVVVFVTTYILILPAITWSRSLICPLPEHTHSESCYQEGVLVCTLEEHEHTEACFDAPPASDPDFFCGHIAHIHNEYCYFSSGSLRCTIKEHVHLDPCMEKDLSCYEPESLSPGLLRVLDAFKPNHTAVPSESVLITDPESALSVSGSSSVPSFEKDKTLIHYSADDGKTWIDSADAPESGIPGHAQLRIRFGFTAVTPEMLQREDYQLKFDIPAVLRDPSVSRTLVMDEICLTKDDPAEDEKENSAENSMEDSSPAEEEISDADEAFAEEEAFVEDKASAEDEASAEKKASAEDEASAEKKASAEDEISAEGSSADDENEYPVSLCIRDDQVVLTIDKELVDETVQTAECPVFTGFFYLYGAIDPPQAAAGSPYSLTLEDETFSLVFEQDLTEKDAIVQEENSIPSEEETEEEAEVFPDQILKAAAAPLLAPAALGAGSSTVPDGYVPLDGTWMKLTSFGQIEPNTTYMIADETGSYVLSINSSYNPAAVPIVPLSIGDGFFTIYAPDDLTNKYWVSPRERPNAGQFGRQFSSQSYSGYSISLTKGAFFSTKNNCPVVVNYIDGFFTIQGDKNGDYLNFSNNQFTAGSSAQNVSIYRLVEDYENTIFLTFVFSDNDQDTQVISIPGGRSLSTEGKTVPTFTHPDRAALQGFRIDGGDDTVYTAAQILNTVYTQNTTFIADWEKKNMINVFFNFGDQTANVYPEAPHMINAGASLLPHDPNDPDNPNRLPAAKWYEWATELPVEGWYLDSNFQTKYDGRNLSTDTTLYAKFNRPQRTITYLSNDGSSGQHVQTFPAGSSVTFWDGTGTDAFTRSHYRLTGWNTSSDGSGTAYTSGASASLSADLQLYAQWERTEYELTITKIVNEQQGITGPSFNFSAELIADAARPDLTFSTPVQSGYVLSSDGKTASFSLSNDQQVILVVPVDASVRVSELNSSGYSVKYVVGAVESSGSSYTLQVTDDLALTVHNITNPSLPETGGIGCEAIYALGILLIAGSLTGAWLQFRRNHKENGQPYCK